MGAEHQPIAKPEKTGVRSRAPSAAPPTTAAHAAVLAGVGRTTHVPPAISPDILLMLQRTAGNAAVSRLIAPRPRPVRQSSPARSATGAAPTAPAPATPLSIEAQSEAPDLVGGPEPVVQRRLIPFAQFQQATGQVRVGKVEKGGIKGAFGAKKKQIDVDQARVAILSGETGVAALTAERAGRGLQTQVSARDTSINDAYQKYEAAPSLKTLIALYDKITYFETLNAGRPWMEDLAYVLNSVKLLIEAEVQTETAKQAGGKGKGKATAAAVLGTKGQAAPAAPMPPFLQEVGVSPGYYAEHLAGKPNAVAALEDFYTNLKAGHQYNAQRAYKKVENLEGMYLIKPLFLAHFAQQANLGGLVGTDAKTREGTDLTPEEIRAITIYSGGSFRSMNAQMRGHDLRPDTKVYGKNVRAIYGRQRMAADQTAKVEATSGQAALMKLVTSGLDKLPKFQGLAYRVSVEVPAGFFAAIRPGAISADLGFSSASPSMTGVGGFANTQVGSKSLYFMIHARTPANIVGLALGAFEAEVLFRPGTRFKVLAVWEHVNGKVPANAPPQAQMVLHAQGEYKSDYGYAEEQWKNMQKLKLTDDPVHNAAVEAQKFSDVASKVKVVELAEV